MTLTGPLVLAAGVAIVAVEDLDELVRDRLDELGPVEASSHALTRPAGRGSSTLVDQALVDLLREFEQPTTVVDAVLRFARARDVDPHRVLESSYAALRRCVDQGYLVHPASPSAQPADRLYDRGDALAGGWVEVLVHALDDVELYRTSHPDGSHRAVKVLPPDASPEAVASFAREEEVLRRLDGHVAPRLDLVGADGDRRWLAMDWCEGSHLVAAAAERRHAPHADRRTLDLARAVVAAYVDLHALGIVHGDVHPGNVLVSPSGDVRLVDFGLAELSDGSGRRVARGGAPPYLAPDHASALLDGHPPGAAGPSSDQYSLGAVLYEVFTGQAYVDFSIDDREALRQIAGAHPLAFSRRGRVGWQAVERILRRALEKDPADRYPSVADLARDLDAITPPLPVVVDARGGPEALLDEVLAAARPGGEWYEGGLPTAPLRSVAYGAAGVAAVLHHAAVLHDSPDLLRLADAWALRSAVGGDAPDAFGGPDLAEESDVVGPATPFHRISGVHVVQALVSHSLGDLGARRSAIERFLRAVDVPDPTFDLTLGRGGVLLATCLLLEAVAGDPYVDAAPLVALGDQVSAEQWAWLDALPPIVEATELPLLGVAHGWGGHLLTSLRWSAATGQPPPAQVEERLDQLADFAIPTSDGLRWPWSVGGSSWMRGWCNGTAGLVHVWTAAHARWPDSRWLDLAEGAARHASVADHPIAQQCCGLAGQAYAQLEMYRHSGEPHWLNRARALASAAVQALTSSPQHAVSGSLHKGDVGVAALASDLARPESASMPFFGPSL